MAFVGAFSLSNEPITLDISDAIQLERCIPREPDATFFWNTTGPRDKRVQKYVERMGVIAEAIRDGKPFAELATSIDDVVILTHKDTMLGNGSVRGSICLSHRGKVLSGTFRDFDQNKMSNFGGVSFPDTNWPCASGSQEEKAIIKNACVASTLLEKIDYNPSNGRNRSGLILLAGGTKSGKSKVARAIALEAIRKNVIVRIEAASSVLKRDNRLPHLVTFEDPIEKWEILGKGLIWGSSSDDPFPSLRHGFCFTPRQKGIDALTLRDAIADAKRQTPACLYVGEIRNTVDWREVLEFAGSGHLVVATTHASSLIEMIAQ